MADGKKQEESNIYRRNFLQYIYGRTINELEDQKTFLEKKLSHINTKIYIRAWKIISVSVRAVITLAVEALLSSLSSEAHIIFMAANASQLFQFRNFILDARYEWAGVNFCISRNTQFTITCNAGCSGNNSWLWQSHLGFYTKFLLRIINYILVTKKIINGKYYIAY